MDLDSLLSKTKEKSGKAKDIRPPLNIATDDRPYDTDKPTSNQPQTGFKLASNQSQTARNLIANVVSNIPQSDFKPITNQPQTGFKTDFKPVSFLELVSLQKELMIIFFQDCKKNGSRITDPLTLEHLFFLTNKPIKSIKSSCYRLENKMLVNRYQFKNGRGGWTRYEIPEAIYREIYHLETDGKLASNRLQTGFKLIAKPTALDNHYSNSNLNTTIGEGWDEIDISPLEHRGFQKNSLLQLKNASTPEIVQASINHFSFSLEHNEKVKSYKDPIASLITVLKRGEAWIDPNYVSPRERAMRALNEARKQEEGRLQQIETELFDAEFKNWSISLTEEQKKEIAPAKFPPQLVQLDGYFKSNLWPRIKAKLLI